VDLDARPAVDDVQPHARRRVIVETLGVADVLEADGVADTTLDSFAMGRVRDPARHRREVAHSTPVSLTLCPVGRGERFHAA